MGSISLHSYIIVQLPILQADFVGKILYAIFNILVYDLIHTQSRSLSPDCCDAMYKLTNDPSRQLRSHLNMDIRSWRIADLETVSISFTAIMATSLSTLESELNFGLIQNIG